MSSRHFARSSMVACGMLLAAGFATQAVAQAKTTELILCNKTGGKISIALAYMDATTGKWVLSAWHNRAPGQCLSHGGIRTGLFYYYAENEKGGFWPAKASAERNYCVPRARVKREMNASACGAGEKNYGFRGRVVDPGKYTFSFS